MKYEAEYKLSEDGTLLHIDGVTCRFWMERRRRFQVHIHPTDPSTIYVLTVDDEDKVQLFKFTGPAFPKMDPNELEAWVSAEVEKS